MKIILAGTTKRDPIGNTTTVAKLYDHEGKLLGRCIDTPNAIATALFHVKGVALVKTGFGEYVNPSKYPIAANKHNPLSFSGYKAK
jgi:hypothetical protein